MVSTRNTPVASPAEKPSKKPSPQAAKKKSSPKATPPPKKEPRAYKPGESGDGWNVTDCQCKKTTGDNLECKACYPPGTFAAIEKGLLLGKRNVSGPARL